MNTARIKKGRLLAVTAVAGLVAGAIAVLSPAQASEGASASSCKSRHVKVYPGDGVPPRWRYGEVDFAVNVCPKEDADGWETNATAASNKTGQSIGYKLESANLRVLGTGENKQTRNATYMGSFVVNDCAPLIEWPCAKTHKAEVGFAFIADKKTGKVRLVYGGAVDSTMPRGMALYRTP
ncbi:hypothetical protein [Streptomyces milbemycinicus]|uniref:hypothetical protein n=1 Tax=Streptomyces milbemycinicus TaxID=476552 RepID=UPI0033DD1DF2